MKMIRSARGARIALALLLASTPLLGLMPSSSDTQAARPAKTATAKPTPPEADTGTPTSATPASSDTQAARPAKTATVKPAPPEADTETPTSAAPIKYKIRLYLKVAGDGPYVETIRGLLFKKLSLLSDVTFVEKNGGEDLGLNCLVTEAVNADGELAQIVVSYAVTSQIYNKVGIYAVSITPMSADKSMAIDRSLKNSGALVDHFVTTTLVSQLGTTIGNDAAKIDRTDIEQVRKFYSSMAN